MDEEIIETVRRDKEGQLTEKLIATFRRRSDYYSDEFYEAIRQILIKRGVTDQSIDLSSPKNLPKKVSAAPTVWAPGIAILGCLVGGLVGYLIGAPPNLTFGDIITRGMFLKGISVLLVPVAESAFNFMLAGAVLGIVGGFVVASLTSSKRRDDSRAGGTFVCPRCEAEIPAGMQFCGKCGEGVTSVTCGKCGKIVPPDQQFCGICGSRVEDGGNL